MRSHNYKLGENQLNYETTAHRVEHNNRVLEPNHQPERSVEEARLDLGKHHYDLGGEDGARTTTHQRTFDKKVISTTSFNAACRFSSTGSGPDRTRGRT
jgi:hypothetical protein